MKYRSGEEIIRTILESANGGSGFVKMMDKSFLSHRNAKRYISVMINYGLLAYDQEIRVFRTTSKGIRYIQLYDNFSTKFPSISTERVADRLKLK
jgi:predicted transcriptional regulator